MDVGEDESEIVTDERNVRDEISAGDKVADDNNDLSWKVGDWVIVEYDSQMYPGEVLTIKSTDTYVHAMTKSGGYWKWPETDGKNMDTVWYKKEKVMCKISPPVPVGSRGQYKVSGK